MKKKEKLLASAALAILLALMAFSFINKGFWKLMPNYHGTVYDKATGAPLAGVYVLAEYREGGGDFFGHSASWCVKTEGAYTDARGRVTLPRGRFGIPLVRPFKEGYTIAEKPGLSTTSLVDDSVIYMSKQVPGKYKPAFYLECNRAVRAADVAANLVYLNLLLTEYRRLAPESPRVIDLQNTIDDLQALQTKLQ